MAKKKGFRTNISKQLGDRREEPEQQQLEEELEAGSEQPAAASKTRKDYDYKTVYLDPELHNQAKAKAALKGLSIKDYIETLIQDDPINL